jgi:hypothetical protein
MAETHSSFGLMDHDHSLWRSLFYIKISLLIFFLIFRTFPSDQRHLKLRKEAPEPLQELRSIIITLP